MTMPRRARCAWWSTLVTSATLHGINSIRLRTFVDPKASDGYDKANGNCDLAHTIAFGKQIKAAGMGLLVDFHYSDNWADPGKGGRAAMSSFASRLLPRHRFGAIASLL
jgi:arabinogalactan endo-1,4-beta-galactosidase